MGDLIERARQWLGFAPPPAVVVKEVGGTPIVTTGDGNRNADFGSPVNTLPGAIGVSPAANQALSSAAVWACCRLISQSVASLPLELYELTDEGKVRATGHPLYRTLTKSPNPNMTCQQWLQPTLLSLLLWGNGYTWVDRVNGEVIAIWPLNPARVQVLLNLDGTFSYYYTDLRGHLNIFRDEDIIHFRVFSMDGYLGLPVLIYQQQLIQFQLTSQTYASNLYQMGGRPGGVLEYPHQLRADQVAAIRSAWQEVHMGPQNAGRIAILGEGTKYSSIGIPPEQLQFIEEQKFSVEQIARIFGVAPHLIGAANQPTYASVEQQSIEFVQYTLAIYVNAIEQAVNKYLLDDDHVFRFNLNGFERGDMNARYAAYATGRQWGWLSQNDVRSAEDMNTIEGGDDYLTPLNMIAVPAGQAPPPPVAPKPPASPHPVTAPSKVGS